MGGNNHRCTEALLKYIKAEYQTKKGVRWILSSIQILSNDFMEQREVRGVMGP